VTRDDFEPWMTLWRLEPDGEPFTTRFKSRLAPVRAAGTPAMLKIAQGEERRGAPLMAWWAGDGAARVLDWDDPAILLERATGERSLVAMTRAGEDEAATRILSQALLRLHTERPGPLPAHLTPLPEWFAALPPAAERHGGILATSWRLARELLRTPRDLRPLHGDLHHENVLDAGARGWLAIDPKGLFGERGFDYAFMTCTPDLETAGAPGVLARRARIVCAEAGLELERYLRWVVACAGLSASWTLGEGEDATPALTIARLAAAELGL